MTPDNRLWILLSRHLSGEITSDESDELHLLLEQAPDKQYLLNILHSYFTAPPASVAELAPDTDLDERLRRIMEASAPEANPSMDLPLPTLTHRILRWRRVGYAAAAAGLIGLAWWLLQPAHHPNTLIAGHPAKTEEIQAKAGARTGLVLPDGTQVWLNSNSKLRYSEEYNITGREVTLEGEAFFDVVKDAGRPFIVHAAPIDIKVLGTAFAIKSYPQEETVEATLLRGSIEVMRKDNPGTARVILKPNEKLVFSKHLPTLAGPDPMTKTTGPAFPAPPPSITINSIRKDVPDSNKVETAWMYNRLVFQGDSFKELAVKMERWYNVKIVFRDESLNSYRFGGAFANETVEQAFQALQFTAAFDYKINGNEIELYAKK